ncbi:hypothetical protein KAI46_05185 [bacterium]|nr:hypothetical protein [bacterium]
MMMQKNFAPTVNIDGRTITPKGYVWVLGFAFAGCEWAIKKASEPEFIEKIRADLQREKRSMLKFEIERYELKIEYLKEQNLST